MKVLSKRERIDAAGTLVVVVGDTAERVRAGFLHDLDVPYPVLADVGMDSYRAWGLGRGAAVSALAPKVVLGYARRILFDRERVGRPGADPLQLGGDFVVAADGTLAYAHPQQGFDDRPPVGRLLRELERAGGEG